MVKCISYWSFEGGVEQKKGLKDAFFEAKETGYDGIELTIGETGILNINSTKEECREIIDLAKRMDIYYSSVASGIPWTYSLTDNDPDIRKKGIEYVKKILNITRFLEADNFLLIPGAVDVFFRNDYEKVPYDICFSRSKESIREIITIAEDLDINICIENVANKFLLSPLEMRDFIDSFNSKKVGSYLDIGNLLYTGGYPEDWIRILGKRIKAVHVKDYKLSVGGLEGFCDLLEGDVNWVEAMKALKDVGYDGTITAEMMPPSEGLLERTSKAMDKIMG
ncbi:MAG: sugar phosphate isomerase/epimerase family protein [Candidatus Theseobacter exili]|nr:sugar phosphate isomerase/epimerase family protein [Candidatus Theseobacter exili]